MSKICKSASRRNKGLSRHRANIIGARVDAVQNVLTRSRSGHSKFRDLVPLLVSRDLLLGVNERLYSACVRSGILYRYENLLKGICVQT